MLHPPFFDVHADLLIEEVTIASKVSTPTAFVTSSSPLCPLAPRPSGGLGGHAGQGGGQASHGSQGSGHGGLGGAHSGQGSA